MLAHVQKDTTGAGTGTAQSGQPVTRMDENKGTYTRTNGQAYLQESAYRHTYRHRLTERHRLRHRHVHSCRKVQSVSQTNREHLRSRYSSSGTKASPFVIAAAPARPIPFPLRKGMRRGEKG
jgi:hypothetical protein